MVAHGVGNVEKSFAVSILTRKRETRRRLQKRPMIRCVVQRNWDSHNLSIALVGTIRIVGNDFLRRLGLTSSAYMEGLELLARFTHCFA